MKHPSPTAMEGRRALLVSATCVLAALAAACGGSDEPIATAAIGPLGGVVSGGGVALGVPEGALSDVREISIFASDEPTPGFDDAISPLYRFEPSGLTFDRPAIVNIDVEPGQLGLVYWTRPGDDSTFEPVGYAWAGRGRANVEHFSGARARGGACAPPREGQCECSSPHREHDGSYEVYKLCPGDEPPMPGQPCTRPQGFIGREGDYCVGWAELEDWRIQCYCSRPSNLDPDRPASDSNPHMCPVPHDFDGTNFRCPPPGDRVFASYEGADCFGYYVARDRNSGIRYSLGITGMATGCEPVRQPDVWRQIGGVHVNCTPIDEPTVDLAPDPGSAAAGVEAPLPTDAAPFECDDAPDTDRDPPVFEPVPPPGEPVPPAE